MKSRVRPLFCDLKLFLPSPVLLVYASLFCSFVHGTSSLLEVIPGPA
jgi:hypothetical protein